MNNHIVDEWVKLSEKNIRGIFFEKHKHLLDNRISRLFAVACCREVWDQMFDERSKKAVEVVELYADGLASKNELKKARNGDWRADTAADGAAVAAYAAASAYNVSRYVAWSAAYAAYYSFFNIRQQGIILASMYPVDFNDNWVNTTTTSLAHNIYDNKDFSLMPILADALQDVDCNEDILEHLKSKGPFYKGNYIIDKLIGKR